MSALGQKQTLGHLRLMSALPPKSGHWLSASGCPLCANSGHLASSFPRRTVSGIDSSHGDAVATKTKPKSRWQFTTEQREISPLPLPDCDN
jgi:hypothetical protein